MALFQANLVRDRLRAAHPQFADEAAVVGRLVHQVTSFKHEERTVAVIDVEVGAVVVIPRRIGIGIHAKSSGSEVEAGDGLNEEAHAGAGHRIDGGVGEVRANEGEGAECAVDEQAGAIRGEKLGVGREHPDAQRLKKWGRP